MNVLTDLAIRYAKVFDSLLPNDKVLLSLLATIQLKSVVPTDRGYINTTSDEVFSSFEKATYEEVEQQLDTVENAIQQGDDSIRFVGYSSEDLNDIDSIVGHYNTTGQF